jgi:tRNA-modifying protein YgfZ
MGDPEAEFRAACSGMAMVDNSTFGRIEVTGNDRLDLLHRLSTNSLTGLRAGGVVSTVFVTDKGRIVDRVIVSSREDSLVLITSPGTEPLLTRWIEKYTITENIRFRTITDETVMVSLIGPRMISTFSPMLDSPSGKNISVALAEGGTNLFVVHSKDSRSDVAHIITDNDGASRLLKMLESLPGARWIGRWAYNGFRIARGIPASPGELNDAYNPFECDLRDSISFTKGCYIGQEVIARLDTYGKIKRHLARIESPGAIPGATPLPLMKSGVEAGTLTSMTEIPFDGKYLGLAIVRNDLAPAGEWLAAGGTGAGVLVTGTSSDN